MDYTPDELFDMCSNFIEIMLLKDHYPVDYHMYYLIYSDNVYDHYSKEIKEFLNESYKKFKENYFLPVNKNISPRLLKVIDTVYFNVYLS